MTIRTPDDEIHRPGYYLPPFAPGKNYQGATYPGHSDFSVDFNRRTPAGGWLDDTGDPVLAAADGTVAEVDKGDGLVMLNHFGGLYRTEYRHMTNIPVKVGQKVQRGDRVGNIGNVAGDGRSFGAHLHHVHYRRDKAGAPWRRVRMTFEDKPVPTSIGDSDTRPESWKPPAPVNVVGPPPKATWESAYREALADLQAADEVQRKLHERLAAQKAQTALFSEERDAARADAERVNSLLAATAADLTACRNATPIDCTAQLAAQRASLLAAVRNGVGALVDGLEAEG